MYHPLRLQELKKCDIQAVIRVCEPTYDPQLLTKEGIEVYVSVLFIFIFEIIYTVSIMIIMVDGWCWLHYGMITFNLDL